MAINFPTSLDALTNPISTDLLENATAALDHDVQHSNANDAIEALEAKVGINSSAVTTSHDYKLGEVTGTDKAVSKTATQTLTNKTLTAPQINFGSDARGDIMVRNASGVSSRFAVGTSGQILSSNASGDPEWVANPAASDASATVKGVVEVATAAEITAGTATGGTGAKLSISPDQLALATPVFNGSGLTNISGANIATLQNVAGIGDATTVKTYNNFQIPWVLSTDVPTTNYWTTTSYANAKGYFGYLDSGTSTSGDVNNGIITTGGIAYKITSGGSTALAFGEGKDVFCEFTHQRAASGSEQMGWGFSTTTAPFFSYTDTTVDSACFVVDASGNLYGHTANGSAMTNSSVISGVTLTNNNTYRIEVNDGVNVKFYVNGVLKATNTTTLPDSGSIKFGFGTSGNTSDNERCSTGPIWFSVEK